MTKNRMMLMLPETLSLIKANVVSVAASGFSPVNIRAPTKMPINREE